MNFVAKPWEPQDLLDDLQLMIDELPGTYLNTDHTTLCEAKAYLEEYFNGLRDGQVLKLPCKPGDTVYIVRDGEVFPMEVEYIYVSKNSRRFYAKNGHSHSIGKDHFNFREKGIGKDVFLTLDEAEAAARPF